jgi:hypothetical protein
MPDVREKLVELLWEYDQLRMMRMSIEESADHLIDNGVTIQRWIPVTERLPDDDIPSARYLCYANGYVRILKYWRMYKSFEYGGKPIKVTHWMPLPEPPKEG